MMFQCRRELLVKMHFFIHLNLAITLCLAYTLFVTGGETAAQVRVHALLSIS